MQNFDEITHHPFHPNHSLRLKHNVQAYACCGCGKWSNGIEVFGCETCRFRLSRGCAVKPTRKYEFVGKRKIEYFLHLYPLTFKEAIENRGVICCACEKPCPRDSYSCQRCPFTIHRSCADRFPRMIQHPSHPDHPLLLRLKDSDGQCHPSGRTHIALTYRCSICKYEMDLNSATTQTESFF